MIPFLITYRKDIAYIGALLAACAIFLWYRHGLIIEGENRIIAQDKSLVQQRNQDIAQQKAADERVLKTAKDAHEREIQAIRDTANQPIPPVRVCNQNGSSTVSSPSRVSSNISSSSGGVQQVPPGDSSRQDLSAVLGLLARRADFLTASARELNAVTHP